MLREPGDRIRMSIYGVNITVGIDLVRIDWLGDSLPAFNATMATERDSAILGGRVRAKAGVLYIFGLSVSQLEAESQLPEESSGSSESSLTTGLASAGTSSSSEWKEPDFAFSLVRDEVLPRASVPLLWAMTYIDLAISAAHMLAYLILLMGIKSISSSIPAAIAQIAIALAIEGGIYAGVFRMAKYCANTVFNGILAFAPSHIYPVLESYFAYALSLTAFLDALMVALSFAIVKWEPNKLLALGLELSKSFLVSFIEWLFYWYYGIDYSKEINRIFGPNFANLLSILDEVMSSLTINVIVYGLGEAGVRAVREAGRADIVLATIILVLLGASIFALAWQEFIPGTLDRATRPPEARVPDSAELELVPIGDEYGVKASLNVEVRDPDGLDGPGIRDVVIALVNETAKKETPEGHVVEDHGPWHLMLDGYEILGWFDLRYDPSDPNSPLKLHDEDGDGVPEKAVISGTFKLYDPGDTPPSYKMVRAREKSYWTSEHNKLYIAVFVVDSDGNEACWLIPATVKSPSGGGSGGGGLLASSTYRTARGGPVTVVVPDGTDLAIGLDAPACFGYLSGRWPTVIIEGPSVYEVGGRRYSSNATVALCVTSDRYELRVLEPERHSISVAPSWVLYVPDAVLVAAAFGVFALVYGLRGRREAGGGGPGGGRREG